MSTPRNRYFAILAAFIAFGAGVMAATPYVVGQISYAAEKGQARAAEEEWAHAENISSAFKFVAKSLRPSVVSINSTKTIRMTGGGSPELPSNLPPEFRRFFGDDLFEKFGESQSGTRQSSGLGSGVIVTEDGYILTNNHVVRDADKVEVVLSDRREFVAEVVGTDAQSDLAVLKIEASGLKPAKLGDSNALEVGDWAIAIGTPFGLTQTVTTGVISAKGRANVGVADYEEFLQTDAAINPGNSGGPLLNLRGEVIGINTAIASRSGGFNGIGFAIPSNLAKGVMESIIDTGSVQRGWLGAAIQDLTPELAQSFGYDGGRGVLVGDVVVGSPAVNAGLQQGDIVLRLNGKEMDTASELRNRVAGTKPGSEVQLDVFRDGSEKTLNVKLGTLNKEQLAAASSGKSATTETKLGMVLAEPTAAQKKSLGVEDGIVVSEVVPGGLAASAGIRKNDVIRNVNGQAVRSLAEFAEAVEDSDNGLRLLVKTGELQRFVFIRSSVNAN
jgi:serine protease Do